MTLAITRADANTYFLPSNHLKANVWKLFDDTRKDAGLALARRKLERLFGVTLEQYPGNAWDPYEQATVNFPRVDYALFEQALFDLENAPIPNADATLMAPAAADVDSEDRTRRAQGGEIAPEAMNWLVRGGGVVLSRG